MTNIRTNYQDFFIFILLVKLASEINKFSSLENLDIYKIA